MTDPIVNRFRFLCDAKCNIVGNVYMYTNPQIAPLNLRKKNIIFNIYCVKTYIINICLPYNSSYMWHKYCKQYAYDNDETIKCYHV